MESVAVGPYLFRLGLYPDPDLTPANLGEAFDYYSAVPGWGWRAVAYAREGGWRVASVLFGASLGDLDFAPPDPEGEFDAHFPCGRAIGLDEGGIAYEGGVAIPPRSLPGLNDEVSVWLSLRDDEGEHGAELRFTLAESEGWDALVPINPVVGARRPGRNRRTWVPEDEPTQAFRPWATAYPEPARPGLPTVLTNAAARALEAARAEARKRRHERPGVADLLLGLLVAPDNPAAVALAGLGIGPREARAAVQFLATERLGATPQEKAGLVPEAEKALRLAGDEARKEGRDRIGTRHLLAGLMRQRGEATAALEWLGVTRAAVREALAALPDQEEA